MTTETQVPDSSLLGAYKKNNAFTDCYVVQLDFPVALADFVEAFYTTRLFKLERKLLALLFDIPSSDEQAHLLSQSISTHFSAWQVESRTPHEIILAAWQTRSWLCVQPNKDASSTELYFGSAVLPSHPQGKFGLLFHLLGGFHRVYSKCLLSATAKKLSTLKQAK
ncbi:hypothetical protein [Marinomonas epiphytica]